MAPVSTRSKPRRRPGISWVAVLVGLLVVVALGAAGYWIVLRERDVATVAVERRPIVKAFYATGTVRPNIEYAIKSKAQGALVQLAVRENQRVEKDQLLAKVDDKQLRFELEKAQAELREAQAQAGDEAPQRKELLARIGEAKSQLEISDRLLKAAEETYAKGAGNPMEVDTQRRSHVQWANALAALESQLGTWRIESKRRLEVAEANARKAQANLADTEVKSPIAGIVLERYVERDQVVSINERLFLVAAEDDKLMKAAVDEEDVAKVYLGQPVQMQLYAFSEAADKPFVGKVVEILPTANAVNKTFEVKVAFEQPPVGLRVGMTAELNFIDEKHSPPGKVLVVPTTAIMDGKAYRAAGVGRFLPVDVTVGVKTLEYVEVLSGLNEGDRVVIDAKQVAPIKLPQQKQPIVPTRKGDVAKGEPNP